MVSSRPTLTQFPPASPGGFARSAGGSDQFLSTIASALGPRAGEILCVSFTSGIFFHSPLPLLKVSPSGL